MLQKEAALTSCGLKEIVVQLSPSWFGIAASFIYSPALNRMLPPSQSLQGYLPKDIVRVATVAMLQCIALCISSEDSLLQVASCRWEVLLASSVGGMQEKANNGMDLLRCLRERQISNVKVGAWEYSFAFWKPQCYKTCAAGCLMDGIDLLLWNRIFAFPVQGNAAPDNMESTFFFSFV